MLNKKRLAMMAVAATMVLPTNLTYILMATPISVLAAEEKTLTQEEFLALFDAQDETVNGKTLSRLVLKSTVSETEQYKLASDIGEITLTGSLCLDKKFNLDLGGNTLIAPNGSEVIVLKKGADLNIKNGTLEVKDGNYPVHVKGQATLVGDSITFKTPKGMGWGLVVQKDPKDTSIGSEGSNGAGSTVTLTNSTFNADSGITVNGNINATDPMTTITLDSVDIHSDLGIYQAGVSTINVNNSTIDMTDSEVYNQCGIETRAGILNVTKSTVTGGNSSLTVENYANGSTTSNAGISISQYKAEGNGNIEVTLDEAEVSGNVALVITDPLKLQNGQSTLENSPFTITVKNSKLTGTLYDVAYTEDTIPFTLENTQLLGPNLIQKVTSDYAQGTGTISAFESEDPILDIPYTLITKVDENNQVPTSTIEGAANESEDGESPTVTISFGEDALSFTVPLDKLIEDAGDSLNLEDALSNALTAKSEEEDGVKKEDGTTINPSYLYEVTGLNNLEFKDTGITALDGETSPAITITLKDESIIKVNTPTEQAQNSQITVMNEVEEVDGVSYIEVSELSNFLNTNKYEIDSANSSNLTSANLASDQKLTLYGTVTDAAPSVTLDENGFVEVTAKVKTSSPTISGSHHKPTQKPSEEPTNPISTPTTMYRLYNRLTGEHLYTIDKNERDNLLTSDTWKDEGEGWIAPSESAYPVYRLLNPNNSDHHYTMDKNEFDTLPSYGWVAEGVAFFSADKDNPENVLLHRLYNPNATGAGSHHYTVDTNERDTLVEKGWTYEGLAWAGLPANK